MLISSGRILVAAVGAVVLVIVAVFLVRSIWWPTSDEASVATTTEATQPTTTSEPSATDESSGVGSSPDDGSSGGGPRGNSDSSDSTGAAAPYTATTKKVQGFVGTVAADVDLPQVAGGQPDVATVFNQEMEKALQVQADSLSGGTLKSRDGSAVRIGERVLSGVLQTTAADVTTASATQLASTVVVDTNSGSIITLSSLFDDLNDGLKQLQDLSQQIGPTTSGGSGFDGSRLEPTEEIFQRWAAEQSGMRIYFEEGLVALEEQGIVDLTIPWDELEDVLKPGVAQIVQS